MFKKVLIVEDQEMINMSLTRTVEQLGITVIISQLSSGTFQKDIPAYLEANNITPSKLSSIEKRLRMMKNELGFSKNQQLVAHCKDNGLI